DTPTERSVEKKEGRASPPFYKPRRYRDRKISACPPNDLVAERRDQFDAIAVDVVKRDFADTERRLGLNQPVNEQRRPNSSAADDRNFPHNSSPNSSGVGNGPMPPGPRVDKAPQRLPFSTHVR